MTWLWSRLHPDVVTQPLYPGSTAAFVVKLPMHLENDDGQLRVVFNLPSVPSAGAE
jgi:hypothetical protein